MSGTRVLLIEFVTTDRFHCALHFPHARGLLEHLGIPVRWLRFAMRAAVQFARGEDGIGLDETEGQTLGAALREHRPTHVVFSHYPAPSALRALDPVAPPPACAVFGTAAGLSKVTGGAGPAVSSFDSVSALQTWLGVSPPLDVDLLSPPADLSFAPTWAFEPANAAAREMQPFVFVLAGAECSFVHSIADNPHFADLVADEEAPRRFGCTFCRRPLPDGRAPRGVGPVDWAVAQLDAVARTHPPSATGQLSLRIVGERVVNRLDEFAERVAALDLAPAEILVDTRSDTLVRLRERFGAAAARLGAAGHRVEVCLIGVETFSARELERFNKGFGPETNLAAARVLRELERDHADHFGFRKYGGLSTVLYTPWTTIEDVALNLATIRHFDLKRICGKALTSRVRLYEELPLAARARRDGLLVDSYDDPVLDTARRNFYESELPWRFRDPRVDRFNRIATRLQADVALAGEPLYEEVQRWRAATEHDEVDLAERLCRAIASHPDVTDLGALIGAAEATPSLRRGVREGPDGVTQSARPADGPATGPGPAPERTDAPGPPSRPSASPADGPSAAAARDPLLAGSVDWRGFVAGIKPVCRLEPLSPAELRRVEPVIRGVVPEAVLRPRRRDWNDVESYELFVGRDSAEVEELVGILDARDGGVRGDEGRAHVRRTGELLGYAPCCVERFADTPEVGWLHNEWLHVRNRVESPGPVPTAIRPLNGPLSYVTCSATCAASLAKAEVLRAKGDESVDPPKARWPMLFLLDKPAHFAVLEPLSPVGERFRYRVAERYGEEERFEDLLSADTLVVEPGQIRAIRTEGDGSERVLAHFSLDAYVWWHERAFHPEYWRLAVQQKLDPIRDPGAASEEEEDRGVDEHVPTVSEADAEAEEAARVPRLDAVLAWMKRYLVQTGLSCRSVLPTADGALDLTLEIGGALVELRWLNRDAPDGVVALLGAPLVPRGTTGPRAIQKLAPRLNAVLAPAWARFLRDRLDRGNREHVEVDPTQGIRFLVRKRVAPGRPLWGTYVLETIDETLGEDGRPRANLTVRSGARAIGIAFEPLEDRVTPPPFYASRLGVLRVVSDDRSDAERAHVAHQVERCLGFHFSRAVPPAAVWGPRPPAGDTAREGAEGGGR